MCLPILSGINQVFGSHLGFSGQKASLFSCQINLKFHSKKMLIKKMLLYLFSGKITAGLLTPVSQLAQAPFLENNC